MTLSDSIRYIYGQERTKPDQEQPESQTDRERRVTWARVADVVCEFSGTSALLDLHLGTKHDTKPTIPNRPFPVAEKPLIKWREDLSEVLKQLYNSGHLVGSTQAVSLLAVDHSRETAVVPSSQESRGDVFPTSPNGRGDGDEVTRFEIRSDGYRGLKSATTGQPTWIRPLVQPPQRYRAGLGIQNLDLFREGSPVIPKRWPRFLQKERPIHRMMQRSQHERTTAIARSWIRPSPEVWDGR